MKVFLKPHVPVPHDATAEFMNFGTQTLLISQGPTPSAVPLPQSQQSSSTLLLPKPRWVAQRVPEGSLRSDELTSLVEHSGASGALASDGVGAGQGSGGAAANVASLLPRPSLSSYLLVRSPISRTSYRVRRLQHFFSLMTLLDTLMMVTVYMRYDIGWERREDNVQSAGAFALFVGTIIVNALCNAAVHVCYVRAMAGCSGLLAAQVITLLVHTNSALFVLRTVLVFVLWLVLNRLRSTLSMGIVNPR
eukprot:PhF_6_TR29148/c0_g1_i1/m.42586